MPRDGNRALTTVVKGGVVALLASAAVVQYLRVRDEARHIPIGQIKTINGRRVHIVDRGSGPCVVLLHGNGSMVEDYISSGLVDHLAKKYRVILIDRPGFGLSERQEDDWSPELEAEVVQGIIDALSVTKPILIAHSWGTLVALNLALRRSNAVSGLILMSGYYFPSVRMDVAMQMPASAPFVGNLLRHTIWPLVGRMTAQAAIAKMFAPQPIPPAFTRSYDVGMATRPSQLKSVADDTVGMPDAARRLAEKYRLIDIPVTLIAGADDGIVSTAFQSEKLSDALKDAQLVRMTGVGHMVHHADSALIAKSVDDLTIRIDNKRGVAK